LAQIRNVGIIALLPKNSSFVNTDMTWLVSQVPIETSSTAHGSAAGAAGAGAGAGGAGGMIVGIKMLVVIPFPVTGAVPDVTVQLLSI
jgi:hypothetical protein